MILYSMTAQQSALLLFVAGILPSIFIGVVDAAYVFFYSRIKAVPGREIHGVSVGCGEKFTARRSAPGFPELREQLEIILFSSLFASI
jgi:TRAP-type C4-dicarboxylate transport system permease large subunit